MYMVTPVGINSTVCAKLLEDIQRGGKVTATDIMITFFPNVLQLRKLMAANEKNHYATKTFFNFIQKYFVFESTKTIKSAVIN